MTKPELIALCENFKTGDRETFQKIIAGFVELQYGGRYDLSFDESPGSPGLAPPTVYGWADNHARMVLPHPLVQTSIVSYIKNRISQ